MIHEKEEQFNIASQRLIKLAADYDVKINGKYSLPYLVEKLRESFKSPEIYNQVFGNDKHNMSKGYCCLASYYIMKNTGGDNVWTLMKGMAHWWLLHKESGKIFDITYDQFPRYYNYNNGVPETRLGKQNILSNTIKTQAMILDKHLGLEV